MKNQTPKPNAANRLRLRASYQAEVKLLAAMLQQPYPSARGDTQTQGCITHCRHQAVKAPMS